MSRRHLPAWLCGVLLLVLLGSVAAGEELHGANSEFVGRGVAMAWAILKAPVEDQSQVVVRIARLRADHAALSIDGVDPFTGERRELLARTMLPERFETRSARASFAELTRREFHFYTAGEAATGRPSLTIYFLGIPDTAPEFLTEATLRAYLEQTVTKLVGGARRTP